MSIVVLDVSSLVIKQWTDGFDVSDSESAAEHDLVIARSRLPLRRRQWRLRAREHTSVSTAALGHEFQKGAGRAHASASRLRAGILHY